MEGSKHTEAGRGVERAQLTHQLETPTLWGLELGDLGLLDSTTGQEQATRLAGAKRRDAVPQDDDVSGRAVALGRGLRWRRLAPRGRGGVRNEHHFWFWDPFADKVRSHAHPCERDSHFTLWSLNLEGNSYTGAC